MFLYAIRAAMISGTVVFPERIAIILDKKAQRHLFVVYTNYLLLFGDGDFAGVEVVVAKLLTAVAGGTMWRWLFFV